MTNQNKFLVKIGVAAFAIIIFLAAGPLYIVEEGTQAVITRFGKVVASKTNAGLYVKAPFIDSVTSYPKRILSLDGDSTRIPTKENQFIIVDTTSRWRIQDPELFYATFKTLDAAYAKLSDIIDSSTRTIITRNSLSEIVRSSNIINDKDGKQDEFTGIEGEDSDEFKALIDEESDEEIISKGRKVLCEEMAVEARKMVGEYGIELIDIVPRQIKYSDELTPSVYSRMIKERNQVAQAYRALGEGRKKNWLGKLENEKLSIESDAYRISEETKGKADAEAAAIYTNAYSKDKDFYEFWKSLESYKNTMKGFDSTFSTDMEYFKYLYRSQKK